MVQPKRRKLILNTAKSFQKIVLIFLIMTLDLPMKRRFYVIGLKWREDCLDILFLSKSSLFGPLFPWQKSLRLLPERPLLFGLSLLSFLDFRFYQFDFFLLVLKFLFLNNIFLCDVVVKITFVFTCFLVCSFHCWKVMKHQFQNTCKSRLLLSPTP